MTVGDLAPNPLCITEAEVGGVPGSTIRVINGRIVESGREVRPHRGDWVIAAAGGAVIPGLHDHHVHIRAMAAARNSVECGPPAVCHADQLYRALETASPRLGWVRGVGYHDSVAGPLNAEQLDRFRADVPLRIQHRSGMLWIVNSAAIELLSINNAAHHGVERYGNGQATGRLFRMDAWLANRLPTPNLAFDEVGEALARKGVTGLTDATVNNDAAAFQDFASANESGALPQDIRVMGQLDLRGMSTDRVKIGQVKIVLDDHDLPSLEFLRFCVREAVSQGRGVAIHAVTLVSLALAVAALRESQMHPGHRIEHAALCSPSLADQLASLGITVVTQPNFVAERGDSYVKEVDAREQAWLYPLRSLANRGVPLGGGTDGPFGVPDPWAAIAAAASRRTRDDQLVGGEESIASRDALSLFLSPLSGPGTGPRTITPGSPAAICVLDRPLRDALLAPSAEYVVGTLVGGRLVGPMGES